MSSRLVTEELWFEIEHFFPVRPRSPREGRPHVWEDLPLELGCSYQTCGRRLREWTAAGVWLAFQRHLLTELRVADRVELADVLIDAGLVKSPLGG